MTISYQLAPIPKWYIADLTGLPLGAGYLAAYADNNHAVPKLVYMDEAGSEPWPTSQVPNQPFGTQGILFDENGSQGPFYWETDSDNAADLYFLKAWDLNGVFQWSIPHYGPPNPGSSSGTTTQNGFQNLIVNSVMNKNFGASNNPIGVTSLKIAPSAHSGLAQTPALFGPDIWFYKGNTTATDQLSFVNFTLGSNELTNDVTPAQFLRYSCTVAGTDEGTKYIQFPITQDVQNLSGVSCTFSIWVRQLSGTGSLNLNIAQFFGDGAPGVSAPVITNLGTFALTTSWAQLIFNFPIPSVTGKTRGVCGNDGLFLQINYPLDTTQIDFIKVCMYAGIVTPNNQLQYTPYDMTEAVTNSDRTGKIIESYDLTAPFGYRALDDTTISSTGSTENISLFPLYNYLWNNVSSPSGNTLCVVSAPLTTAVGNFVAGDTLTLQPFLGRALASAGTGAGLSPRALGSVFGEEDHTMLETELATHSHTTSPNSGGTFLTNVNEAPLLNIGPGGTNAGYQVIANTGDSTPFNIMQPTSFVNFYIKL